MQERVLEEFVFMASLIAEKYAFVKGACSRNVHKTLLCAPSASAHSGRSLSGTRSILSEACSRIRPPLLSGHGRGNDVRGGRLESSFLPEGPEEAYMPR